MAGLQAQLSDLRDELSRVRADNQLLLDKLLASLKPQSAAVLHPRQITAFSSPPSDDQFLDPEPPPPSDIEAYVRSQGAFAEDEAPS